MVCFTYLYREFTHSFGLVILNISLNWPCLCLNPAWLQNRGWAQVTHRVLGRRRQHFHQICSEQVLWLRRVIWGSDTHLFKILLLHLQGPIEMPFVTCQSSLNLEHAYSVQYLQNLWFQIDLFSLIWSGGGKFVCPDRTTTTADWAR